MARDGGLERAVAASVAAAVGLALLLLGGRLAGGPGLLEAIADAATGLVPLDLFDRLIALLGPWAKSLLFVAVAGAVLVAGAGLGWLLEGFLPAEAGLADGLAVGGLAFGMVELVLLPVVGYGFFGSGWLGDPLALHGPVATAAVAYGLVLAAGRRPFTAWSPPAGSPSHSVGAPPEESLGRRRFLAGGLLWLGAVALATSAIDLGLRIAAAVGVRRAPPPPTAGDFGPTPLVTPLDAFYVVAKDLVPPRIDPSRWRLQVSGLVDGPQSFALADLARLPRVAGYRTLQCISLRVTTYDDLIGNQRWAGWRLRDLLTAVGIRPGARFVWWRCADGYTESLPLADALADTTWLVDEMGPPGTPLAPEHGFPLRVLVAGRYGMKQPKWLTEIVVASEDRPGFWEGRGWDEAAVVRTYARIDRPGPGDQVVAGAPFGMFGIANAGDRGIAAVEVSLDGGMTWRWAEVERSGVGLGPLTWVRWRATVQVERPGAAILAVRAVDGQGVAQDGTPRPPLPSGATGYHRVPIVVVPG
jgi:DMSO/TMAO reductase YedYZ molybdopterin-dependent catalytic subunit